MKRVALAIIVALAIPVTAPAHEQRAVGEIRMSIGWETEPAYANVMNNVFMALSRGGQPVTDMKPGEIKVDVTFGNERVTLDLQPAFVVGRFGSPGEYTAPLMPTRTGTYVFRFTGSHDGIKIDSTFTCGEKTFSCVEDPKAIQFPAKDPSGAELNQRLDREFPRVQTKVAGVKSEAGSARLMGMIGIALGLIALAVSLLRGRGPKGAAGA